VRACAATQPARWGFYAWGAIYAYQGLGAFYALVPHGYGTNGVKERLVRVAGACWPFGWTCLLVWQARACAMRCNAAQQRRSRLTLRPTRSPAACVPAALQWCFSQYRMIAAWLFLQGTQTPCRGLRASRAEPAPFSWLFQGFLPQMRLR
jgi:hypothetical protein